MKVLDEDIRQRISDASIMYDEKLKSHFLFYAFDGKQMEPRQIPALLAARHRDGKMDITDVVATVNPWMFDRAYLDKKERLEREEQAASQTAGEPQTQGQRFRTATWGLLKNMGNGMEMGTAWVAEIARRLWNDDNIGAYKEFSKGVEVGEHLVQRAMQMMPVEAAVSKVRSYLIAAFDASVDALKGDFQQASLSARPLTSDLRRAGDVVFVQTGALQMMQNLGERMTGTSRRTNPQVSLLAETMDDARAVLHSDPVLMTVSTLVAGMEQFERQTRMDNPEVQKLNSIPEDKLEAKHDRLSDVRIYTTNAEMFHYIRCKIDGVQQSSRELRHQDYQLYQMGQLDRFQLAEKYYAEDMHRARVAGLGR